MPIKEENERKFESKNKHNKQKQEKVKKSQHAEQKEAQESAIKAVARSMLPTLPGGFRAQFSQINNPTE